MSYLITKIIICLALAALIGFIIGWLFRGIGCKKRQRSLINEAEGHLGTLQGMREDQDILQQQLHDLEIEKRDLGAQVSELKSQHNGFMENAYDIAASAASKSVGSTGSEGPRDEYDVEEIEGIGPGFGKRLRKLDINTTLQLLQAGTTEAKRQDIAKSVDIEAFVVKKWISMADLIRVPGIRGQFAELLQVSGVESAPHLAEQDATILCTKMTKINAAEHHTRTQPTEAMVAEWIENAKDLTAVITD